LKAVENFAILVTARHSLNLPLMGIRMGPIRSENQKEPFALLASSIEELRKNQLPLSANLDRCGLGWRELSICHSTDVRKAQ
jgi:hypothetical protein